MLCRRRSSIEGWPHFGEVITEQVQNMVRHGRPTLVFINCHYSKDDEKRGCPWFNYDTQAARAYTDTILRSFFCLAAPAD